ncbi:MAG: tetratricopeptide repeat protein [Deltaproteobacteria bacterium]|nr:tetratricopeptide repeat protein [Deltaproteobacteria bacterium]
MAIVEKAFGLEHPNVATALENYAAFLRKTGRRVEAEQIETRAKAIRIKHAGQNSSG